MNLIERLLWRSRLKAARSQLAESPSASSYVTLASEHARAGAMADALRVCQEGLELYPENGDLKHLAQRARQMELEDRTRRLTRELRESPRPALYRELSEIFLQSGRPQRAEECALEWHAATQDPQALVVRAQARLERFYSDRRREDGRLALELLESCIQLLPEDERVWRLQLAFTSRIGAWSDARRAAAKLLEILPGDPALEARYRALGSAGDGPGSIDKALREVERFGKLADDQADPSTAVTNSAAIRPLLRTLGTEPGVLAALYTRGATALVQGPRGATAERTARSVREIVQHSRAATRRLGLGQTLEVVLEGGFGSLAVVPGDQGASALWSEAPITARQRRSLADLVGAVANTREEEGS